MNRRGFILRVTHEYLILNPNIFGEIQSLLNGVFVKTGIEFDIAVWEEIDRDIKSMRVKTNSDSPLVEWMGKTEEGAYYPESGFDFVKRKLTEILET